MSPRALGFKYNAHTPGEDALREDGTGTVPPQDGTAAPAVSYSIFSPCGALPFGALLPASFTST